MKRYIPVFIVLILFILLFLGLQKSMKEDLRNLPSPFINKAFPTLEVIDFNTNSSYPIRDNFKEWTIVNFWASWCITCRVEHPVLEQIHNSNVVTILGINYKDTKTEAKRFLTQFANPFDKIIFDSNGKVGLELGVYAIPETFLVDSKGIIRHKHLGELTEAIWQKDFLPFITSSF